MMLCSVCAMLMSNILIYLKGCAKTVPLHTTLPANPRHWLGADPKTTPVGLCTTRSQVIPNHRSQKAKHSQERLSFSFIPAHGLVTCFCFLLQWHFALFGAPPHCFDPLHSVFLFHMDTRVGGEGACLLSRNTCAVF